MSVINCVLFTLCMW